MCSQPGRHDGCFALPCLRAERVEVVVVGGGIAGLASAWHLVRQGVSGVCILEREATLGAHASGRNAAILRHVDDDEHGVRLALRSRTLLGLLGGRAAALLRPTGTLFLGRHERLRRMAELAAGAAIPTVWLAPAAIGARVPVLAGGDAEHGLLVAEDGVLDTHALLEALARGARARGARVRTGVTVAGITRRGETVTGVRLANGEEVQATTVVVAAGAWSAGLGATCAAPMPLESRRRHLAMLVAEDALAAASPVVWKLDGDEVYFRAESGGILASPCDEEVWPAGLPPCAPDQLGQLAERLSRVAPGLATARVRRAWACLRTFAPDGGFLAGADPRCRGLFWIAGLGGRGMSCGLALGELVAAHILGQPHVLAEALAPARLLAPLARSHPRRRDRRGRTRTHVTVGRVSPPRCAASLHRRPHRATPARAPGARPRPRRARRSRRPGSRCTGSRRR